MEEQFFEFVGASQNDTAEVTQRLKEYSFYFLENIEENLNFFLALLEDRDVARPKRALTPKFTIFGKIDKNNAHNLADFIYYFRDNKNIVRQIFVEASVELFYSFEDQFMRVTTSGGATRAMQILAYDAAEKVLNYFIENNKGRNVDKDDVTKGVILGSSHASRTVEDNKKILNTGDIYSKVGWMDEKSKEFFSGKNFETSLYGYRRILTWEDLATIKVTSRSDFDIPRLPNYSLTIDKLNELFHPVFEYFLEKFEAAQLDRDRKHSEIMQNLNENQESTLSLFKEKFGRILEELKINYQEIVASAKVDDQNQFGELQSTLCEIKEAVIETKEEQIQIGKITKKIEDELVAIKDVTAMAVDVAKQNSPQNSKKVSLTDLVVDQAKKNNPEPRIRKEIKRFLKKI